MLLLGWMMWFVSLRTMILVSRRMTMWRRTMWRRTNKRRRMKTTMMTSSGESLQ